MSSYGVLNDGFAIKLLEDIIADLEASNRNAFGAGINQSATSVFGQLNGTYGLSASEIWELAQSVYRSMDPNSATGEALDFLCLLTGVSRIAATKSTVTLSVDLDAAITLTAGRVVSAAGNANTRFVTLADVTSTSSGVYSVEAEAESTGPVSAVAGSLTVIETPYTGWNSVTNLLDAAEGRSRETDSQLRIRREALLRATGAGTVDSIRADILDVADVTECIIFENETDVTDVNGVLPHSFESIVRGGDNNEIAQAIWDSKPAGIRTVGAVTATATDTQGNSRSIKFSRPSGVDVYVKLSVVTDSSYNPVSGPAAIKAAVVDYMNERLRIGDDVITTQLYAPVFSITGVIDVPTLYIGILPSPGGSANITIAARELALFDTSRVEVV